MILNFFFVQFLNQQLIHYEFFLFLLTLIFPPIFFKVFIKPILVLLKRIFLTISLDPGFKQAAEIKNAADDGSPGTL